MSLHDGNGSEEIVASILGLLGQISTPKRAAPEINLTDKLESDLNVDSLGFIEFVMGIEVTFNIEVEDDFLLMGKYPDVQSVVDYVIQQANSKPKELL